MKFGNVYVGTMSAFYPRQQILSIEFAVGNKRFGLGITWLDSSHTLSFDVAVWNTVYFLRLWMGN